MAFCSLFSCTQLFQQLNHRQIHQRQSVYSKQLSKIQRLYLEDPVKERTVRTAVISRRPARNAPCRYELSKNLLVKSTGLSALQL